MAGINFFGTSNNQNSLFGSSNLSLGDYGLIRSGAYKKLVKSYYNDNNSTASKLLSSEEKAANNVKSKEYMNLKTDANNLRDSITDITSNADELFATKEVEGKVEFADKDKALKAVKGFVDSYNSLLEGVGESDDKSILRSGVWMTSQVSVNSKLLDEVGISIGTDNKLSIDEAEFSKADATTLKSLFGTNSYSMAGSISSKAVNIASQSTIGALKLNKYGALYNNNASFNNVNSGTFFDGIF